jgi:AraC-like DNA-binding protein
MVFDGEYFDQSHFIKDFKMITGESPNHFFKRNLELVKVLSGKN